MTTVRVAGDALLAEHGREGLAADEVALDRVVEVGVPVDLDGPGDVARFEEQHVLIGLDDDEAGGAEVACSHSVDTSRSGCAYAANFGD